MFQQIRDKGSYFIFPISPKKKTIIGGVISCFISSFVEFRSKVSEKNLKISQSIRGRVAILFFRSAQKNHKIFW